MNYFKLITLNIMLTDLSFYLIHVYLYRYLHLIHVSFEIIIIRLAKGKTICLHVKHGAQGLLLSSKRNGKLNQRHFNHGPNIIPPSPINSGITCNVKNISKM